MKKQNQEINQSKEKQYQQKGFIGFQRQVQWKNWDVKVQGGKALHCMHLFNFLLLHGKERVSPDVFYIS